MSLLDRVKERCETDLDDPELQRMIDEALEEIILHYGPNADPALPITVTFTGGRTILDVARPIDITQTVVITETTEWDWWWGGSTVITLNALDYRISNNGRTLERLHSGPNYRARWGKTVTLTYTPLNDGNKRQEVAIKLVQLSLQYQGLINQSVGDTNQSYTDYCEERDKLLGSLAPRKMHLA